MPYRQNVGKRHSKAGDTDGRDVDGRTPGTSIRVFKTQQKHTKEVKGEKGKEKTGMSTGKTRRQVNEHTHNNTWFLQIKRVKKINNIRKKRRAPGRNLPKINLRTRQSKESKKNAKTVKRQSRNQTNENKQRKQQYCLYSQKHYKWWKIRRENFHEIKYNLSTISHQVRVNSSVNFR